MEQLAVRRAESKDIPVVAELFHALWPTGSVIEHAEELTALLADNPRQLFPDIVLVAEALGGRVVGFLEVDLRSHADGCNPSHPVGYIEGWYVVPSHRQRRIGATLAFAAEEWARQQGCTEMASDTWVDNVDSQSAHEALGFEVVDRCVHYRKNL